MVSAGFFVRDDCLLLNYFSTKNRGSIKQFTDKTGFECAFNSFHISDYVESGYLENGLKFLWLLLAQPCNESTGKKIRIILSDSEDDVVFKLHVLRAGEDWISNDLEYYTEAILVIDSDFQSVLEPVNPTV